MTVNAINGSLLSVLSAIDGVALSGLAAINGQTKAAGGAFTPPITTNLIINWDTRTIAVADGTALTTGQFLDSSSAANHPINANPSNRPVYRATGGPGGLPSVEYNGLGAFALTNQITSSDRTIYAILKHSDANPRTIIGGNTGAFQYRIYLNKQNLVRASITDYGSSTSSLSTSAFNKTCVTFNQTTRAFAFRLNGSADGSGTGGGSSPSANDTDVCYNPSSGEIMLGFLSHLLIYTGIHSGGDISTMETWLNGEWGV